MTPVKIDINKVAQDIAFEHGGSVQIHELGGASQEEKTTTEMRVGGGADTNAIRFGPIKNLKIEVSGNGGSTEGLREENSRATTPSKWLLELEKLDKYYEKNGERGVRAYIDRKQVISFIDSLLSSERQRMVEKANQYVEGFKVKYRGCGLADSILALEEMRDYLSLLTDKEELKDITK